MAKPSFLTLKRVAAILGVSRTTIYEYARKRKSNGFPAIRVGRGNYKIPRTKFLQWAGLTEDDV